MSNFDDDKQQLENQVSDNIVDNGRKTVETGGKIVYKSTKKIGTSAGKKLAKRSAVKKAGFLAKSAAKAVATGIMNIGRYIITGLISLLGTFIAWGWPIILALLVIVLIFWIIPATKQYTLDSLNKSAGVGKTTNELSAENLSMHNYFQYYSDRMLKENKVKIEYDNIDYEKIGSGLFEELNDKEYIVGPFIPNKIVPPKNTSSNSGGMGSDSGNSSFIQTDGSYSLPKINDIIKVEWNRNPSEGANNLLKAPALNGAKLTESQIKESQFLVYDIESGETFFMVRTMGTNHNDVEYATSGDAEKMKQILGSQFNTWSRRKVFVIQGQNAILASWTTANHAGLDSFAGATTVSDRSGNYGKGDNLDYISNGVDGHMDLYFHKCIGHKEVNYKPYSSLTQETIDATFKNNAHGKTLTEFESEVSSNKQYYLDMLNNSKYGSSGNSNDNSNNSRTVQNQGTNGTISTSNLAQKLVNEAVKHKGKNYKMGKEGPNEFDCSGLIYYSAKQVGIEGVPRTSKEQRKATREIKFEELKPGDLIFSHNLFGVHHVQLYIGNGLSIEARDSKTGVVNREIKDDKSYSYGRLPALEEQSNNNNSNNTTDFSKITIMIDPGHGGEDPGAKKYVTEKDINLQVSLKVQKKLKELGFNIIMSRDTDKTLSYSKDRTQVSNASADLCVSIHSNAGGGTGIETFYPKNKSNDLATHVQTETIKTTSAKNRGVKDSTQTARKFIGILDNNTKPVALIELGYVDNKSDAELLADSTYQEKLATGIANGILSYLNKNPNLTPGSGSGNSSTEYVENIVDEMEGFIGTEIVTDAEKIKKENIDKLVNYWIGKSKPTQSLTWEDNGIKKELNEIINYGYTIKPFEQLKTLKYKKDLNDDEKQNLKDKYGREAYFNIFPEFLYSLNDSLFKQEFYHNESLSKPVKVNENRWELDYKAFNANGSLTETEKMKYGLGTVFIYRPVITFKIEKGIEINQVEVVTATTTTKPDKDNPTDNSKPTVETTYKYDSKPTGRVINNYEAKIEYVLDRAITFAGEYIFTYEEEINLINEQNVDEVTYDSSKEIYTGRLLQSKTYQVTEVPKDVLFNDKGSSYLENYLGNFITEIPKNIVEGFNKQRIYQTFEDYVTGADINEESEEKEGSSQGGQNTGAAPESVERWRTLCTEIGVKYGIDENILLMMIENESTGNLHIVGSGGAYSGLSAMRDDGSFSSYVPIWFKDDSEYKRYTVKDVWPNGGSCKPGKNCDNNDAEHERVARFHIEYLATRITKQMSRFLFEHKNINTANTDTLTPELIYQAMIWSTNAYNTGEGGQNALYKKYGDELYSYPGTYYTQCHWDTPAALNSKYNAKYLEKNFEKYAKYSGNIPLTDSPKEFEYDVTKWTHYKGSGIGGGGSYTPVENDEENTNLNIDMQPILDYVEYEKGSWMDSKQRYTTTLDTEQIQLMLANAVAMKEEITLTEVESGCYSFWDKDYIKKNFNNGLPKGRTLTDFKQYSVSNSKWKKVLDTVEYIRNFEPGSQSAENVVPFNTSNLIGHAYYINAGIKIPRTPKAITDDVKIKVDSIDDIVIGDILVLKTYYPFESASDLEYPTETAICIGNDDKSGGTMFAMISGKRINSFDLDYIKENYEIMDIVRPIEAKKTNKTESNKSSQQQGEWIWPMEGTKISSDFGPRNVTPPGSNPHMGIDISPVVNGINKTNVKVFASKAGEVISVKDGYGNKEGGGSGNQIKIKHDDGTTSYYMHLLKNTLKVSEGDMVEQGQWIATSGNSGTSFGPHLDFRVCSPTNIWEDIQSSVSPDAVQKSGSVYWVDPEQILTMPEGLIPFDRPKKYSYSYQLK